MGKQRQINPVLTATFLILVTIACSLYFHNIAETSMNQSEDIWQQRADYYRNTYPPSTRMITTAILDFLYTQFEVNYFNGFFVLQYLLMFIIGLVFFFYLKALGFSPGWSNVGMMLMLWSYPILCAHFQPNHTWDDLWEYIIIAISYWLLVKNRLIQSSALFALGIIFRDAIMVIYPAYLVGLLVIKNVNIRKKIVAACLPILAWGLFVYLTYQSPDPQRWILFQLNFSDTAWSTNTILSLMISFGVLWLTALASTTLLGEQLLKQNSSRIILLGAIVGIPLVVITTLTLTLARETRIFFPVFIYIIPLSLWFLQKYASVIRSYYTKLYGFPGFLWLLISLKVGLVISNQIYPEGLFRAGPLFTEILIGIHIGLALALFGPVLLHLCLDQSNIESDTIPHAKTTTKSS